MTKVFMRSMLQREKEEFHNGTVIAGWTEVFENKLWSEEDIYINDTFHHAGC